MTHWRNRDLAFVDIALGIERIVLGLQPELVPQKISRRKPLSVESPMVRHKYSIHYRRRSLGLLLGMTVLLELLLSVAILQAQRLGFLPLLGAVTFVVGVGVLCILGLLKAIVIARRMVKRSKDARHLREEALKAREEGIGAQKYYEHALDAYEQVLRQNSSDAIAYRGKGNALTGLGRYDEAVSSFKKAVALMPRSGTYVNMGNVLMTLECYEEAVVAYEHALECNATYTQAYVEMSEALFHLGRMQEAQRTSEQAKQLGYDD